MIVKAQNYSPMTNLDGHIFAIGITIYLDLIQNLKGNSMATNPLDRLYQKDFRITKKLQYQTFHANIHENEIIMSMQTGMRFQ